MIEQSAQYGGGAMATTSIGVGGDNRGIIVVGNNAVLTVKIDAEHGSRVSDFRGTLPIPKRRDQISLLPRRGGSVIGRDQELSDLRVALGANGLIQLCGPAGIGKSALLRHAARTLDPGLDGVVYLHAGDREAAEIAREIFKACYVAPDYVPSVVELQQYLQHLRLRIYVDDPRFSEPGLKQLMDIVQNSALVFTTEQRIAGTAVRTVPVGGLDESASINLLAHHLNRSLRDDERPAAMALCAAAKGSPLQLRRFAASSSQDLLPAPMPSLLAALLRQQSPEARDVLHLIASVGGDDIAPVHLDALLGRHDCDRLCRELARTGLIIETDVGYRCPADVIDEVLKSRGISYPIEKLCRYLTAWAEDAATSPDAVADHHRILDALVLRAERDGHPGLGVALARAASPKLEQSLHFSAWGTLLGAGWRAAEAAKDKNARAYFLNEEGVRSVVTGKLNLAALLLAQAAVLWQELGILHKIQAAHQSAQFAASNSFPALGAHGPAAAVAQAHAHMATLALHSAAPVLPHAATVAQAAIPAVSPLIPQAPAIPPGPHAVLAAQPRPTFQMPGSGSAPHAAQPAHGAGHVVNAAHHHKQVIDLRQHMTGHGTPPPGGHASTTTNTNAPVHHHHQHLANAHHAAKAGAGGHGAASAGVAKTVTALVISASVFGGVALVNHLVNSPSSQDPSCQSAVPAIQQAIDTYNSDNSGSGSEARLVGDLQSLQGAIQSARTVAKASTITSALDVMHGSVDTQIGTIQSYLKQSTQSYDTFGLTSQFNDQWSQVTSACGE